MKKKTLKRTLLTLVVGSTILLTSFFEGSSLLDRMNRNGITVSDSTPCMQMYNSTCKYAEMYDVPKEYAFGLSYEETRYKGPADTSYFAGHVSPCGALGPNQIMYSTAKLYVNDTEKLTKKLLKYDIDFNVRISMRILADLKKTYKTWPRALGAYHTGKPVADWYAKKIIKKTYIINWIELDIFKS